MKLIDINKARYRKHLKWVMAGCAVALAIGSLAVSQTLIAFFPDAGGDHFHWNLLGVIISAAIIFLLLKHYREHDFMTEVVYVWNLKQSLNKISRKMRKLEAAASEGNVDALQAIHYCYSASRLLWTLDDNTLLMSELTTKQAELNSLVEGFDVTVSADDYDEAVLKQF